MVKVISKAGTSLAYRGLKGRKIVLLPGENHVSGADLAVLEGDAHFAKHVTRGHMEVVSDPKPEPVAAAPDPLARKTGEKKADFDARLALLTTFSAMSADEQAATYETLADQEKGWVNQYRADTGS